MTIPYKLWNRRNHHASFYTVHCLVPGSGSAPFRLLPVLGAHGGKFRAGEWVEDTARAIWGEEVPIVHEDAGHWTWHETEGIYTPPHMGVGSEVLPYPHSITQTEDGWTAEVSYLLMNMGGVSGTTEEYQQEWIPLYEDLDSDSRVLALLDTLPRWTITARYDADGVLHLVSCQPAE